MSGEPVSISRAAPEPWQPTPQESASGSDGVVNLSGLAESLLAQARADARGTASTVVVRGPHQRAVLIALTQTAGLAEHNSPPAATLHCLLGRVRLHAGELEWIASAGHLVTIPEHRHAVDALEDSVFLLTVTPPART